MKKITKKTRLNELIDINSKAVELLSKAGMHCIGCPMAMQETLEQGCLAHGVSEKDVEKLVRQLNKE